jgi:hypothetical protein
MRLDALRVAGRERREIVYCLRPAAARQTTCTGAVHTVSVDASWTETGPVTTTVNRPGAKRKERSASATASIVFDGNTLVSGAANFPFPAPFIRVDMEK